MKKWILLLLILALLLCGCSTASRVDTIQVSLTEGPGFEVLDNGRQIHSGNDVVFQIRTDPGVVLTQTSYPGSFELVQQPYGAELILFGVDYPTQVSVMPAEHSCVISYYANGGRIENRSADSVSFAYDLRYHVRPNTAIGTDRFFRPGYTLLSWNTRPDGSGDRIGLGSRVSVPEGRLNLFAQWGKWAEEDCFTWTSNGRGVMITGYSGVHDPLILPEQLGGEKVTAIDAGAFAECPARQVVLPVTLERVRDDAFRGAGVEELTFFDNIIYISDKSFSDCQSLRTLHIQVREPPYGYLYRRESVYADKLDLLLEAQGQRKLVCYGGCSIWYNMDDCMMYEAFGSRYQVLNMGLNGTVNSLLQMQILSALLEPGDILFHTPELSSPRQLLYDRTMTTADGKLWCGLENNYDLLTLVDVGTLPGVLDSLQAYLSSKGEAADPEAPFMDREGRIYVGPLGGIPFERNITKDDLPDRVFLDPIYLQHEGIERLGRYYAELTERGIHVYLSYACVNMDAVPEEQRGNVAIMDELFRQKAEAMGCVTLVSHLQDFLYTTNDFYDTNYHLRSDPARENTAKWIRDLKEQMIRDGLWEEA